MAPAAELYVPAGHAVQVKAPASEDDPETHTEQEPEPGKAKVPGEHVWQDDIDEDSCIAEKVPPLHEAQTEAPLSE
jgi:hypothetical protein